LGVAELGRRYREASLSPVEVVEQTLDRIQRLNPDVKAYITVLEEPALKAARAAEMQFSAGIDLGPLQGIPVSAKDVFRIRHTRTTAASRVLQHAAADTEDAPAVLACRAAGAVVLGKTNLDEFGVAKVDPDGPFGTVQNPRKSGHQAGGSSSGSAAAVAAGLGAVSLGTDAGGSVRHPASVCGVAGLKPTHGLLSLCGVISSSPSLDHVGLLARSVADLSAALTAIVGWGRPPIDGKGERHEQDATDALAGLRVGIPLNDFCQFGQPDVRLLREQAQDALTALGLIVRKVVVPWIEKANDIADTLLAVDHLSFHGPHVAERQPYGAHLLERVIEWRRVSASEYARAKASRRTIREEWRAFFDRIDVLLLPANGAGAPRHGEDVIDVNGVSEPVMRVNSRFNRISNLTGFPALVVPVGKTDDGLPVAVQLVAAPLREHDLLTVGQALEGALGNLPGRWGVEVDRC
jgi:aspartyl-tRNA(Asn)/glutamyl-tRNA(Gln) amidotransferase subunit A